MLIWQLNLNWHCIALSGDLENLNKIFYKLKKVKGLCLLCFLSKKKIDLLHFGAGVAQSFNIYIYFFSIKFKISSLEEQTCHLFILSGTLAWMFTKCLQAIFAQVPVTVKVLKPVVKSGSLWYLLLKQACVICYIFIEINNVNVLCNGSFDVSFITALTACGTVHSSPQSALLKRKTERSPNPFNKRKPSVCDLNDTRGR